MKVLLIFVSYIYVFIGCQTTKSNQELEIPKSMLPLFSKCGNADGGAKVSFTFENKPLNGLALDWIKDNSRFAGEISNPLGQTVMSFEIVESLKKVEIKSQNLISNVSYKIDSKGFLEIDGHRVGIKTSELSCLLEFKIPFSWSESLSRVGLVKKGKIPFKYIMEFEEEDRVIWTSLHLGERKLCSKIKWSEYLGLVSHKIIVCQHIGKSPWKGEIRYGEDYDLEWITED